jgi:ABC-type nickel/cobalt efflux system permease component RcnA
VSRGPLFCGLALALCLALGAGAALAASGNPFLTPQAAPTEPEVAAPRSPSLLSPLTTRLAQWQLTLRSRMAALAQDIREAPLGRSFWLFMALSLAYGVAHALGPGHSKVVTASYFLHRPGSLARGLAFGQAAMFVHGLSAAAVVFAGKFLFESAGGLDGEQMGRRLETVSYVLLCAVGGFLLVRAGREALGRRGPDSAPAAPASFRELALLALAAGVVPCPGASLVLLFSISLGIPVAGLLALASISLGMGLTVSGVAVLTIATRGHALERLRRHGRAWRLAHAGASLVGALALTGLGLLLLAGQFVA